LSFINFGGDFKGMEKSDLRWVHSSGSGGNNDIARGNDSDFGNSLDSVRFDNGDKFKDGFVGEN